MDNRKTSILIIEDEPEARESLKNFLLRRNFDVVTAEDGEKGIDLLINRAFDIILTDLRTPSLDPIKLLDQVSKNAKGAEIIVMTAHPSSLSLHKSERVNVFAYLQKPISFNDLLPLIDNIEKLRGRQNPKTEA